MKLKLAYFLLIVSLLPITLSDSNRSEAAETLSFYLNTVRNTSKGAIGVEARTHIKNRHPGRDLYLVALKLYDSSGTGIAWEIAEKYEGSGFFPVVHIRYPIGSEGRIKYPNGYFKWFDNNPVSVDAWHTLKITNNSTSGSSWDLYLDGVLLLNDVWYPYWGNNYAVTQLEAFEDSAPYYFFGRHSNIKIRGANGAWWLQDSSWGGKIAQERDALPETAVNPYTRWIWNILYSDWEARTP